MALRLTSPVQSLGADTIRLVQEMGALLIFFVQGVGLAFVRPFKPRRTLEQVHFIGFKSLLVILLTGGFTGMVLGLQGYYTLVRFGSEGMLGALVSLTLIREIGPVFTAIMITARAGSAMSAEIGIMRISEQIDALKTMDIHPVRFLLTPRLLASLVCFPLLTALYDLVGIFGGYLSGSILLGSNPAIYMDRVRESVEMNDITGGFTKSFVFAVLVCSVCCYMGYTTHRRADGFGARGVSRSTTTAVVLSSVLILVADYVLTSFLL
ncbi:MAG: ABC transporter permease [Deltaproteobacteria bacterium]|nr:ABC transporter permease [Deltaproteobacteria bacterium]